MTQSLEFRCEQAMERAAVLAGIPRHDLLDACVKTAGEAYSQCLRADADPAVCGEAFSLACAYYGLGLFLARPEGAAVADGAFRIGEISYTPKMGRPVDEKLFALADRLMAPYCRTRSLALRGI